MSTNASLAQTGQTATETVVLCDTGEDGASTPFLRHLSYRDGQLVQTADTGLDGAGPYTPAGVVGVCADTADRYSVQQRVLCDQTIDEAGELVSSVSFLRRYIIDTRSGEQVGLPQDVQLNGLTPYEPAGTVVADCSATMVTPPPDPCAAIAPGSLEPTWAANSDPFPGASTVSRTAPFTATFPQPLSVSATTATVNGRPASLALVSGTTYRVVVGEQIEPCTEVVATVQPVTAGGCPDASAYTSPTATTHANTAAYAWGWNPSGRLGDGTAIQRNTPVAQATEDGVHFTLIDGGAQGSNLAIDENGDVWAWGYGGYGQLANGTTTDRLAPARTLMPNGVTAVAIAAAANTSAFLSSEGRVYTAGYGGYGQLGTGGTANRSAWSAVTFPDDPTITKISAGMDHMLALTSTGEVYGWGYNGYGNATGTSSGGNVYTPVRVALPEGTVVTDIAAGSYFNVVVDDTGQVWTWGLDNWQQLGDGNPDTATDPVPQQIPMPEGVTADSVYAGYYNASFTTTGGDLYVWGSNYYGSAGQGTTSPVTAVSPTLVTLPDPVISMAWCTDSAIACTAANEVYTWGYGGSGQMANGTTAATNPSPLLVTAFPAGVTPTSVAACDYAMFATADVQC